MSEVTEGPENNNGNPVGVGEANFHEFREKYKEAQKLGRELFVFENQEVNTLYAKYLIEYMEMTYPELREES